MKDWDENTGSSPPATPDAPRGVVAETRARFGEMSSTAIRHAEREQRAAVTRGPLAKLLMGLTIASVLFSIGTGVYGIYNFPDAPIRERAGTYVGKGGTVRTAEDYLRFETWKTTLLGSFMVTFLVGFAANAADARNRRRHGLDKQR